MTDVEAGPWRYVTKGDRHPYTVLVCTLPVPEWGYDDDDHPTVTVHECGGDVYVSWSFSIPVGPGDVIEAAAAPTLAVASTWEASCEHGHTLAVSSRVALGASDTAEPFVANVVFGQPS